MKAPVTETTKTGVAPNSGAPTSATSGSGNATLTTLNGEQRQLPQEKKIGTFETGLKKS